jgi:hypothetical protein
MRSVTNVVLITQKSLCLSDKDDWKPDKVPNPNGNPGLHDSMKGKDPPRTLDDSLRGYTHGPWIPSVKSGLPVRSEHGI